MLKNPALRVVVYVIQSVIFVIKDGVYVIQNVVFVMKSVVFRNTKCSFECVNDIISTPKRGAYKPFGTAKVSNV